MRYRIIVNPRSGTYKNKKNLYAAFQNIFPADTLILETHSKQNTKQIFEQIKSDTDVLVVAGGDGTINDFARYIVNTDIALGIIPMGSGNGLARSLGVPSDPLEAARKVVDGDCRYIDVGKINSHYFFCVAGFGADAYLSKRFELQKFRGLLVYFFLGVSEYFKYKYPVFRVLNGTKQFNVQPLIFSIANAAQYGNGAKIAPQASLEDGLLNVCMLNKLNIIGSILALRRLFNGTIAKFKPYSTFVTDKLEIYTEGESLFHVDGETFKDKNKFVIEAVPKALKVIV